MAGRLIVALLLLAGCATQPDGWDARHPGDRCADTCPEGMACTGTAYRRRGHPPLGRCELLEGRCMTGADCRRSQRCVRTGDAVGLCADAPQI